MFFWDVKLLMYIHIDTDTLKSENKPPKSSLGNTRSKMLSPIRNIFCLSCYFLNLVLSLTSPSSVKHICDFFPNHFPASFIK